MEHTTTYTSGHIKVIQRMTRRDFNCILDEPFSSRKDLWRLLFNFKGSPVEVVISFDEPTDDFDLEATLDTPI